MLNQSASESCVHKKNIAAIAFISYIKADKNPEPHVPKRKMLSLDECDITAATIHQENKKIYISLCMWGGQSRSQMKFNPNASDKESILLRLQY